jgi:hypothetical protein
MRRTRQGVVRRYLQVFLITAMYTRVRGTKFSMTKRDATSVATSGHLLKGAWLMGGFYPTFSTYISKLVYTRHICTGTFCTNFAIYEVAQYLFSKTVIYTSTYVTVLFIAIFLYMRLFTWGLYDESQSEVTI